MQDNIKYRRDLKRPLTAGEVDANFEFLAHAVAGVQFGIKDVVLPGSPAPFQTGQYPVKEPGVFVNFKDSNGQSISVTNDDFMTGIVYIIYNGNYSYKYIAPIPINGEVKEGDMRAVSGGEVYKSVITKNGIKTIIVKNLFNKSNIINAYINNISGDLINNSNAMCSFWIKIQPDTAYSISGRELINTLRFRDENGDILKAIQLNGTPYPTFGAGGGSTATFLSPPNAVEIQFSIFLNTVGDLSLVQLEEGLVPTDIVPFKEEITEVDNIPIKNANKDIYDKQEVDSLLPQISEVVSVGKNKADVSAFLKNKYLLNNNGQELNGDGFLLSNFMSVEEGKTYAQNIVAGSGIMHYYDSDKTWLSANPNTGTFTIPLGVSFVRRNLTNEEQYWSDYNTYQLEEGTYPTTFEPYNETHVIEKINGVDIVPLSVSSTATKNGSEIATVDMLKEEIKPITLLVSNNTFYVRTRFNETEDLVQRNVFKTADNTNQNFSFSRVVKVPKSSPNDIASFDSGIVITNNMGDDTAPINTLSEGHIMEGHGSIAIKVLGNHLKTNSDISSRYIDTQGFYFRLVKVVNTNELWFLAEPVDNKISRNITGDLTYVSGGVNTDPVNTSNKSYTQGYPVHKNQKNKIFIDGYEVSENGIYNANQVMFYSEYEVSDMTDSKFDNPFLFNSGEPFLKINVSYTYQKNGMCVTNHLAEFLRPKSINYWYVNQMAILPTNPTNYPRRYSYIPDVMLVNGVDYKNIAETTALPPLINFTDSNIEDSDNPPSRHIQFLADSSGDKKIGMVLGFNTEIGVAKNTIRKDITNFWQIAASGKSYPRIIYNFEGLDQVIQVVGYRGFFDTNSFSSVASSVYRYDFSGSAYIIIDYHQQVLKDRIKIDKDLVGKKIEIIHSTDSFALLTDEITPASELVVSVNSNYGYAIIKITK